MQCTRGDPHALSKARPGRGGGSRRTKTRQDAKSIIQKGHYFVPGQAELQGQEKGRSGTFYPSLSLCQSDQAYQVRCTLLQFMMACIRDVGRDHVKAVRPSIVLRSCLGLPPGAKEKGTRRTRLGANTCALHTMSWTWGGCAEPSMVWVNMPVKQARQGMQRTPQTGSPPRGPGPRA
ncbi:hypothetical protein HL42_0727 [Trichophyton rubrum]|nr:hypothetical protein HL42_0727 [Trichophyton rubrum]